MPRAASPDLPVTGQVDVIGDAYMAVTNLLDDQPADHAARLARFAVAAAAAARDTPLDTAAPPGASPGITIRAGIHCGPAAAGVLGAHGLKYTLVGDTVNTASRMESSSAPGHVQCSAAAAVLIASQAPELVITPRAGGVEVKGKGHMQTFWVGTPPADQLERSVPLSPPLEPCAPLRGARPRKCEV